MGRRRGGKKFQERREKARAFGKPPPKGTHNIPVYKRLLRSAIEQLNVKTVTVKQKIRIVTTETFKGSITIVDNGTNVKHNKPVGIATRFVREPPLIPAVRDWDTASEVSTLINDEIAAYLPAEGLRALQYRQANFYIEPPAVGHNEDLPYLVEPHSPEVITID